MKRLVMCVGFLVVSVSALARPDVNVSVNISPPMLPMPPTVYGRIDIGRAPMEPALVYAQPMMVAPPQVVMQRQPIYLHVPPGHSRDWRHHCHRYNACGQQVYFVQRDWYQQHYRPQHQPQYGQPPRARDHDHRRDRDWDDGDRGRGRGHGHHRD